MGAVVRSTFVERGRERVVFQDRDPDELVTLVPFGPVVARSHLDDGPEHGPEPQARCRLDFDERVASFQTAAQHDTEAWLDYLRFHRPLWAAIGWTLLLGEQAVEGPATGAWKTLPRSLEAYREPLCPLLRDALERAGLGIGWRGRLPVLVALGRLTPPHAVREALLSAAHDGRLSLPELRLIPIEESIRVAQPPLVLPTRRFSESLDPRNPIDGLVRFVAALRAELETIEDARVSLAPGEMTLVGVPQELVWPAIRAALAPETTDADGLVAMLQSPPSS